MSFRFASQDMGRSETGTWIVDARTYRDPARFEHEITTCLTQTWFLATHASLIANESHFVWEGFDQSVVITRHDEQLHAFHNVCQHRGSRIVASSGLSESGRFRCPWHGWVYDTAGALVGVPRRELFDAAQCSSAPAVAVAEFAGFVWLHLGDDPEPLDEYLAEVGTDLDGYGMDSWILAGSEQWPIPVNWKVVVDGFSEDYHAHTTHRRTIPKGLQFDDTRLTLFDRHSMMVTPFANVDYESEPQPVPHRATAYCHYTAFPTTVASCFPSHAQIMSIVPRAADATELRVWIVGSCNDGDEKRRVQLIDGFRHFCAIAGEDVGVLSELAPTARSMAYRRNMFGRAESRLRLFHTTLARYLGAADDA